MRRMIVPMMCLALIAAAGCGDTAGETNGSPAAQAGADAGIGDVGGGDETVPKCPFTAAQVSEIVGQDLRDDGNCSFGDGIAVLGITMATATAGEMTYDYQHQQAQAQYDTVTDLDKGKKGYLGVKDIRAEMVVISDGGSYTVTMSSFERLGKDPGGYEQALRKMLDRILA